MRAAVPVVGVPELESNAFTDIDMFYQYVGAAHLSGRRVISSEIGAAFSGAYSLSARDLTVLFQEALVAGVNSLVVHGMPYGGEFMSTWPGYTPLSFGFGDMWGRRLPDWSFLDNVMTYAARNQLIMQTGTPKKDVAFYLYDEPWSRTDQYKLNDLRSAGKLPMTQGFLRFITDRLKKGYSYEYLGATDLASEAAKSYDRVLAPQGPGYRALVFNQQAYISPEAALKVLSLAQAGLPIISLGSLPNTTIGSLGQEVVSKTIASVSRNFSNVRVVERESSLLSALEDLGVKPRLTIRPGGGTELYSFWRHTERGDDLVFLYNRGSSSTYKLAFEVGNDAAPYQLDAWTGSQSEVTVYERNERGISLAISLAAKQTTILYFSLPRNAARPHVTGHSENVELIKRDEEGYLHALVNNDNPASITLSDENCIRVGPPPQNAIVIPPVRLGSWNLTLHSWVPGGLNVNTSRSKIETFYLGQQTTLVPWSEIPGMGNVSGVGIYTNYFDLPSNINSFHHGSVEQKALLLHVGTVLNILRVWANSKLLPPIDPANPEVDVTAFLTPGTNKIRVETSSTLFNAVRARVDTVSSLGQGPVFPALYTSVGPRAFGLIGPVTIRTLRKIKIDEGLGI